MASYNQSKMLKVLISVAVPLYVENIQRKERPLDWTADRETNIRLYAIVTNETNTNTETECSHTNRWSTARRKHRLFRILDGFFVPVSSLSCRVSRPNLKKPGF